MQQQVTIITGGASGIGKATAQLFVKNGAKVYVLDKKTVNSKNSLLKFIHCNVSDFKQLKKAVERIYVEEKRIDNLFANAGVHLQANIEKTSLKNIDNIIDVNLKGVFYSLKAVIPIMRKQKEQGGNIVVMGSDQTTVGKPENSIYGATKAAIGQLAKSTALDYVKYNIRVNCICPGATLTPLTQNAIKKCAALEGINYQQMYAILEQDRPMKRFGQPQEIAELVWFLCSDKASFITGALINIDGGYTAQ